MTSRDKRGRMGAEKLESLADGDEASWQEGETRPQWWMTTWNEELPCRCLGRPQS